MPDPVGKLGAAGRDSHIGRAQCKVPERVAADYREHEPEYAVGNAES
jgi:hypothetical protein